MAATDNSSEHLLPHLRWELEQVMSRVRPGDLSTREIVDLLAILAPAHARLIGARADDAVCVN